MGLHSLIQDWCKWGSFCTCIWVAAVARSTFAQVHFVCQLHLFLDWEALQTVIHTQVTSQLDYCNVLYMGLVLEDQSEVIAGSKFSSTSSNWSFSLCPCVTIATRAALAAKLASECNFKVLVLTYKARMA